MGTASPWCTEARTRGCSCHRWVQGHVSRVTCHVYHVSRVQVVGGGAAARAGLRRGDRVVRINSKVPRSLEEAVSLLKKSKVG